MAVKTSKIIKYVFTTAGGSTFTLAAAQPGESVGAAEAVSAAEAAVASNIFITPKGELTGVRDIKIIETATEDLFDPPRV